MKKLIFLFVLSLLLANQASATHIAGADLSYTCIGGNDYLITLTFYRDCSGVAEPSAPQIKYSSSCGTFTVTLAKLAPTAGVEVTPVCPGQATYCSGGNLYGLRKFVYQAQVTLPPCSDWVFSYTLGTRNFSNTISNPEGTDMTIQAHLNNVVAPCNSSPVFTNPPSTIICNGQQFCYNHGAIDPENDSLVYQFVTPFDDGPGSTSVYVQYTGGYTASQPLPSSPPVTLDPVSGDICMTPTQNIITVMAVLVQEWRTINGVPTLIGSVSRDMQVAVIDCYNNLPTLAGINPSATQYNPQDTAYLETVCYGETVDFSIYSHDPDTNNLTLSWNNAIPGASFTVTGNGSPTAVGHFHWTPGSNTIGNTPHCFTVNVRDDNCPYVGQQTLSYCIIIKGMVVDLNPDVADSLLCMGENYTLVALGDTNVVNYYWTLDGSPVTPFNDSTLVINSGSLTPGDHDVVVTVDDGSAMICPGVDHQTLHIVPQPDVNLGPDDTICNGQTVVLDAGPGAQYFWVPTSQQTQTITVGTTGYYTVQVNGGNNTRCMDFDTVYIQVLYIPTVDLGPDLCVTDSAVLNAGISGFEYHWTNQDGNTLGNAQTLMVNTSGTYTVQVAEMLGHGCDASDQVLVKVIPEPVITTGPDLTVCQHQSSYIEVTGVNVDLSDYAYTYHWYPGDETTPFIVRSWLPEGNNMFIVSVTGCSTVNDTINLMVNVCELTIPNVITPNGDSQNDRFVVPNLGNYPGSALIVYNRWGKVVYESDDYQNDWGGGSLAAGVYYYILKVNYGDTGQGLKTEEMHGTVTIIR